jgi:alkylation response protein AidB-like acyl-CoA dehydrogenase
MRFVVHELHDSAAHMEAISRPDVNAELIDSIFEEAAKFAQEVLLPINANGDEEGCHYENGVVRTPKGFKQAYDLFRANGWGALSAPAEFGGQDLPEILSKMVAEPQANVERYDALRQAREARHAS